MIRLMVGAPENSGIKQAGAAFPVNKYQVNQVAGFRPITLPIPGELMDGLVLEPSAGNNQITASTKVKKLLTILIQLILTTELHWLDLEPTLALKTPKMMVISRLGAEDSVECRAS